jgi:hypothetical protein
MPPDYWTLSRWAAICSLDGADGATGDRADHGIYAQIANQTYLNLRLSRREKMLRFVQFGRSRVTDGRLRKVDARVVPQIRLC